MSSACRVLMRAIDRGVHGHVPHDRREDRVGSGAVRLTLQRGEDPLPRSVRRSATMPLVDRAPRTEPLGRIPPRHTRPHPIQDPVQHHTMRRPPAAPPRIHRQQRLRQTPLAIRQITTPHEQINDPINGWSQDPSYSSQCFEHGRWFSDRGWLRAEVRDVLAGGGYSDRALSIPLLLVASSVRNLRGNAFRRREADPSLATWTRVAVGKPQPVTVNPHRRPPCRARGSGVGHPVGGSSCRTDFSCSKAVGFGRCGRKALICRAQSSGLVVPVSHSMS